MKYRIEETIDGNDVSTFRVQEKILWWWMNCMQWRSKKELHNQQIKEQMEHYFPKIYIRKNEL
jgi:hypothetical protein